jgi:hypothetical protein
MGCLLLNIWGLWFFAFVVLKGFKRRLVPTKANHNLS